MTDPDPDRLADAVALWWSAARVSRWAACQMLELEPDQWGGGRR